MLTNSTLSGQSVAFTIPTVLQSTFRSRRDEGSLSQLQVDRTIPRNNQSASFGGGRCCFETAEILLPPTAYEAQTILNEVIPSRCSNTTQSMRDIPEHPSPFILPRRATFEAAAEGSYVTLPLNVAVRNVTVSGDLELVTPVMKSIKSAVNYFTTETISLKLSLPRRQHRLLTGKNADDIMVTARCAVILLEADEATEEIVLWGKPTNVGGAVQAVMEKTNSAYIHEFPLPSPLPVSPQFLTYMSHVGFGKTLADANPGAKVFLPHLSTADHATVLNVDIVSEKPKIDAAVNQVSPLLDKLYDGTKEPPTDRLLHRFINSHKNAKKIEGCHGAHNMRVFFPPQSAEQSTKIVEDVDKEISKMARDASDVKTETMEVEKKWHDAVAGRGALEDVIVLRGISTDVNRVPVEIRKVVEDAKNDETMSSYAVDFNIDSDEGEDSTKKKKPTHLNSMVNIVGRKENFEEEKRRILAQAQRLADDTSKVLKIPHQYHSSLISLRDKLYSRQWSADGERKTREALKPNEGFVKGGHEGVAGARQGLLGVVEFEKEANNDRPSPQVTEETSATVDVPSKFHRSITDAGGQGLNDLIARCRWPTDSNAQTGFIRFPRQEEPSDDVRLRGEPNLIAKLKAELEKVAADLRDRVVLIVEVPVGQHNALIGRSDKHLNDLQNRTGARI
ncbi:hypothetical protein C8Q76DRAFT_688825 [Earliella scabrosa]|nr:hypothetical protein C8Q76DRAFT_688825 [Earliella scabrosa]